MTEIPTILVCIDSSSASFITLKYACLKAKKLGFAVQILSVIEPSHKNLLFGSKAIGVEKRNNLEKYLQKLISDVNVEDSSIIPVISIREGEVASEIAQEIKSMEKCVMIVFGKSNSSSSDNVVLPKIAHKIGTKIKIPIVIVPESLDKNLCDLMS